jgi:hypothetical protein
MLAVAGVLFMGRPENQKPARQTSQAATSSFVCYDYKELLDGRTISDFDHAARRFGGRCTFSKVQLLSARVSVHVLTQTPNR